MLTGDRQEQRKARLGELEKRVAQGRYHMAIAADAGEALAAIRDEKLYMLTHSNFEEYVKERWGWSRARAYELMTAAAVLRELSDAPDKPTSLNQAIALGQVPAGERAAAWAEVVEHAPKDADGSPQLTEEVVKNTTQRTNKTRKNKRGIPKPRRVRIPGGTIVIERNKQGTAKSDEELLQQAISKLAGDTSALTNAEARRAA